MSPYDQANDLALVRTEQLLEEAHYQRALEAEEWYSRTEHLRDGLAEIASAELLVVARAVGVLNDAA